MHRMRDVQIFEIQFGAVECCRLRTPLVARSLSERVCWPSAKLVDRTCKGRNFGLSLDPGESTAVRLCCWHDEVVAHPKRGRRPGLEKEVEDEESRVANTVVPLEFE